MFETIFILGLINKILTLLNIEDRRVTKFKMSGEQRHAFERLLDSLDFDQIEAAIERIWKFEKPINLRNPDDYTRKIEEKYIRKVKRGNKTETLAFPTGDTLSYLKSVISNVNDISEESRRILIKFCQVKYFEVVKFQLITSKKCCGLSSFQRDVSKRFCNLSAALKADKTFDQALSPTEWEIFFSGDDSITPKITSKIQKYIWENSIVPSYEKG